MIQVQHRVNTIDQLSRVEKTLGVEIDIRNHGDELYVVHDPFLSDEITLADWLVAYDHRFLIVNVKEEGLETKLLKQLEQNNIEDFFILDESLPFIRKYALLGVSNFAIRVSELESINTALAMANHLRERGRRVKWIWVDSFTGAILPPESVCKLKSAGFRLCQVSPELHHVDHPDRWEDLIRTFRKTLDASPSTYPDMVCTKLPDLWAL